MVRTETGEDNREIPLLALDRPARESRPHNHTMETKDWVSRQAGRSKRDDNANDMNLGKKNKRKEKTYCP